MLGLLLALSVDAQKIARLGQVPYSTQVPTNTPSGVDPQVWFNTSNHKFYTYTGSGWAAMQRNTPSAYGELSMSNDSVTLSFAATTALPVENLTTGPVNLFSVVSDSVLKYNGPNQGTFKLSYSACLRFTEANNVFSTYLQNGSTQLLRSRSRVTVGTATSTMYNVSGQVVTTLTPGDTVRLMMVPSTHTGTDSAIVKEANIEIVQIQ